MRTYIAAGINIQRDGTEGGSGQGPAQLTKFEITLSMNQKYPSGCGQGRNAKHCIAFGLGLQDDGFTDPNDPAVAVEGMRRRIQRLWDMCTKKCSSTDKFIIAALGQNGSSFDIDDMDNVINRHSTVNGDGIREIKWEEYFKERQDVYTNDPGHWNVQSGSVDIATAFMLKRFYLESMKLTTLGYALPWDLDHDRIKELYGGNE